MMACHILALIVQLDITICLYVDLITTFKNHTEKDGCDNFLKGGKAARKTCSNKYRKLSIWRKCKELERASTFAFSHCSFVLLFVETNKIMKILKL